MTFTLHSKHVQHSAEPAVQSAERRQQGNACVLRVKRRGQGVAAPRPMSDLYGWTVSLQGIREVAGDLERKRESTKSRRRSCSYDTLTYTENIRKKNLNAHRSLRQINIPTSDKHEKVRMSLKRKTSPGRQHLLLHLFFFCVFFQPRTFGLCTLVASIEFSTSALSCLA